MVNAHKVGLVFGVLLGGWHAVWALLVVTGVAQMIYDFVLWAHMIHLPIVIGPFDIVAALTLVIFTGICGYIMGYVATWVWNRIHRA